MANDTRRPGKKRRSSGAYVRGGVIKKLIIMLAIVAALVFGVAVFFKVQSIEVQGNSLYSAEEIIEASAIQTGDNLLTLNKAAVGGSIKARLPYVESVSVGRSMPDTVILQVHESEAAFAVLTDTNTAWIINASGKAMEKIDTDRMKEYPQIIGVTIHSPAAGQIVEAVNETEMAAALQLMSELDGTGILNETRIINVEKDYDIFLQYGGKYEIRFGGTDQLDYKVRYLVAILGELSDYQAGVIDLTLTDEKVAVFHPES